MSLKLSGITQLLAGLAGLIDDIDDVVGNALEQVAREILAEAKKRVPVDTGFLRSSGQVEAGSGVVHIRFTADYAAAVHERTERSYQNGEAKYLERAVNVTLSKERASEVIAQHLREAL